MSKRVPVGEKPQDAKPAIPWVPDRGEVILVDRPQRPGRGRADQNPFLVLSPRAFNTKTGLVIGCAMANKQAHNPFAVANPKDAANASYILADQPKSFDWRGRHARRHPWGNVATATTQEVSALLGTIVQFS